MSLPVAATISAVDSMDVLQQNLAIARGFQPITEAEMQALRERCKILAADGRLELFKVTKKYDGGIGRDQYHYSVVGRIAGITFAIVSASKKTAGRSERTIHRFRLNASCNLRETCRTCLNASRPPGLRVDKAVTRYRQRYRQRS